MDAYLTCRCSCTAVAVTIAPIVSARYNLLSFCSRPSFVSIGVFLHQILHHLHTHFAVAQISRVQSRAIHVPSQAVKRVAVILVFFWRRYRKVSKVSLHVLFTHPVAYWTQWRKFHSQKSALCNKFRVIACASTSTYIHCEHRYKSRRR